MEPAESIDYLVDAEPAPGRLALVERFVNTVDFEHGREVLSEPERLRAILGLEPEIEIGQADLRRALEVREALRSLALANNGGDPDPQALAVLERAAARGRLVVRFGAAGAELVPVSRDVDGALADLVGVVHTATADGTWSRLKACRRDVCHWVFYDRSRNRSAVWCRMAVCGNRIKTRAYRERRATPPARTGRR
jgi:predicted RNA-binding Zn ribbon-like protein